MRVLLLCLLLALGGAGRPGPQEREASSEPSIRWLEDLAAAEAAAAATKKPLLIVFRCVP